MSLAGSDQGRIRRVGVVGAGAMGWGIAQVALEAGYTVTLWDLTEELAARGLSNIQRNLQRLAAKGKLMSGTPLALLNRISLTTDLGDLEASDYIIEAIIEKMEVKKAVYEKLDAICPPEVIFASNTSGLSITEIASATQRADRVICTHFFNPPPRMEGVEVVRGYHTSDATFAKTEKLLISFGKTVIEVKESPLFVVNRILIPMITEAIFVLEEGLASESDIDQAMKLAAHHPIGPLALADFIGLDVVLMVGETLFLETGDSKYRIPGLLRQMVRAGQLGRKTGQGFFDYRGSFES